MSSFRPGRGHSESRRTVFYTNEEWELLDPPPKDLEESLIQEERKKQMPEGNKGTECTCAALSLCAAICYLQGHNRHLTAQFQEAWNAVESCVMAAGAGRGGGY